jgi:hypothetical protein
MSVIVSAILSSISVTCDHVNFDLYNCEENNTHTYTHTHTHTHTHTQFPNNREYFLKNEDEN